MPNNQAANEPEFNVNNIQGNIIPGFNKDFQAFLFLKIEEGKVDNFRRWLEDLTPRVTTMKSVLVFRSLLKDEEWRGKPAEAFSKAKTTWINIAFSYAAFKNLVNEEKDKKDKKDIDFGDKSFTAGLKERSQDLGDPTDAKAEGHPQNWVVGGPNNEADVIVIVASDDRLDLFHEVTRIENSLYASPKTEENKPGRSGVRIIFKQYGANLPEPRAGYEHFGFRDGISQPGVRGRIPEDPDTYLAGDYLTPRQHSGGESRKPGQDLVWPGKFVFGYPDQEEEADPGPSWARDGSFLVFRRLRQDVGAFHSFLHKEAQNQGIADPNLVGARCVGRWPSGTPILHDPKGEKEKAASGQDEFVNNDFTFMEDPEGEVCPFHAHIRKVRPRDDDKNTNRLLRRGIPYGEPSWSSPTTPCADTEDRGLLFLAYQTSIENQFEYLQKQANDPNFKKEGAGRDPIIGQDEQEKVNKWVIPTGGGYFFTPSIEALHMLAESLPELRDDFFFARQIEDRQGSSKISLKKRAPKEQVRIWAYGLISPQFKEMLKKNPATAVEQLQRAIKELLPQFEEMLEQNPALDVKQLQRAIKELLPQFKKILRQSRDTDSEKLLQDLEKFLPKAITPKDWARIWAHAWLDPQFKEMLKKNPAMAAKEFQQQAKSHRFPPLPKHDRFFDVVGEIYEKSFGRGPFMNMSFESMSLDELAEIAAKATLHGNPFCMQQNEWVPL